MKRYNVYCFGARPGDDDIEVCPDGRWVEASEANARIAELEKGDPCGSCRRKLDAANARIAELERKFTGDKATFERLVAEKNAATARADEAAVSLSSERTLAYRLKDRVDEVIECAGERAIEVARLTASLVGANLERDKLRAESDGRHTANLALCAEVDRLTKMIPQEKTI